MTTQLTPNLNAERIAKLTIFDAFRLAEELLESRYPRDAVRVLAKVLDAEPANAAAIELLGRAHFAAAQLAPAEMAFRRLLELEPTSAWAHTALGLALDRQNRHTEGALFHRMATAMGSLANDATRVALTDNPAPIGGNA